MSRDKTSTHKKVMAAAREEFMASGYEKASMRSIAGRCGMTAAGLYRHCRDKEDLFDQLAAPAVQRIEKWQEDHLDRYKTAVQKGNVSWQDSWVDMMRDVVYPHMEDYHLLLAKAQGSKYGNYLHEMTEKSEGQFWAYLPCLRSRPSACRRTSGRCCISAACKDRSRAHKNPHCDCEISFFHVCLSFLLLSFFPARFCAGSL